MVKDVIVGIDLGTTYSAIAYINEFGKPEIIPNEEQSMIMPSVVYFEGKDIIVGEDARNMAVVEPSRIVEYVKRQMGKTKDEWCFELDGKEYSATEISSLILSKLKKNAEKALGVTIRDAVITVPAYFNESQREATVEAGLLAKLNVLRIINEPTAAALSYGVDKIGSKQNVFVFDLGGGTFDVTVMKIEEKHIQILATNGDHMLGGKDWDDEIIKYVSEQFQAKIGVDPLDDLQAYQDIQSRAVQTKIALSARLNVNIICNYAGKSLNIELTKGMFERITTHLVDRCKILVEIVLGEAKLKSSSIDTVLLVGGSTRMPMVREMLKKFFGKDPDTSVNPDECVAIGAAIQGALLGLEKGLISKTAEKYLGEIKSTDVNSHSLGIVSLKDGKLHNSVIIPKNQPIPCEKSKSDYVTSFNNQTSLDIYLTQGEDSNPENCTLLGSYEFNDIPPRPTGKTKLEVTFKYNLNSMVEVDARDVLSNKILPKRVKKEEVDLSSLTKTAKPQNIALLIDCSGSMAGQKIMDAQMAALKFAESINLGRDKVGIISFGGANAIKECELTSNYNDIKNNILKLEAGGGNPMWDAIDIADKSMFDYNNDACKTLIIVADGDPGDAGATLASAERVKTKGVTIIAIGVGAGADEGFLRKIVSTKDDYHFVNESFQLSETFISIATELSSQIRK